MNLGGSIKIYINKFGSKSNKHVCNNKIGGMVDYEELRQEVTKLGFDLSKDKIVRLPGEDNLKEYAVVAVPLGDQDLRDIAYFDFGVSPKVNPQLSLLDHLVVRVERKNDFLQDRPIVLMQQAFRADWGPLPSKQCLIKRANDYLTPDNIKPKHFTTLEGRLKAEFEKLGFSYKKMIGFPSDSNTICLGQIAPLSHISHKDDLLISTFNISLNIDPTSYPIDSMTASLRRSTPKGDVSLMREIHFGALETLPTMTHIDSRADEILRIMKVSEKFYINQEGRLINNDHNQTNQMRKGI